MHNSADSPAHRSTSAPSLPAAPAKTACRAAIAGAAGYAGQEVLRLLARHPSVHVTAASAPTPRTLPALARIWTGPLLPMTAAELAEAADVVILAVADAQAAELAPALLDRGCRVIDLSGAFRLRDAARRARWYPDTPAVDEQPVYGLTEHHRCAISGARLIACAGCYPTAALLALRPLVTADLVSGEIVIDAKSGLSGAGRTPSERTHFSECHGSVAAYGVFAHRHAAEIEEQLGREVTFVPHLVPLDRGLLETIYVRLRPGAGEDAVSAALQSAYEDAPFVRLVGGALPSIRQVAHTNFCDIGWMVAADRRAVIVACLDNLVKGAAGQAIQNLNIAFGLDERTGLWP